MTKEEKQYIETCPKSYDLKHIWREGTNVKPLSIFGLSFFNIGWGKPVLIVKICQACGMIKRVKGGEL